jgi:two-component system, chemotaxis family, chemotaxis protein CheY
VPHPAVETPRQRHCLIVDDSRVVRKVSRRIVEALGYVVTEAENGQEALGRCQLSMPDLVLLDWDMPIMTGIEFIASFRAIRGNEKAKAVFCTSKSGAHDIHRGIAAGADEYVTKPFDEATLRAKLQAIGAI